MKDPGTPHFLAVAPDRPQFAIGRDDGTVELRNLTTGKLTWNWQAHAKSVLAVSFSPDGQRLVTGGNDGTATVWALATQREIVSVTPGSAVSCVVFSPDGKLLATTGSSTPRLWDAITGDKLAELRGHRNTAWTVAFSPDGQLLASASLDNEARLWQVPSGKLHGVLKGHVQGLGALAFSPDGKTLATGAHDRRVKLWHVATQQEMATLPAGGFVWRLCFSPDGRRLAVGSHSEGRSAVRLWRASSFEEIAAAEAKDSAHNE
jgi:WD40 repeat protein